MISLSPFLSHNYKHSHNFDILPPDRDSQHVQALWCFSPLSTRIVWLKWWHQWGGFGLRGDGCWAGEEQSATTTESKWQTSFTLVVSSVDSTTRMLPETQVDVGKNINKYIVLMNASCINVAVYCTRVPKNCRFVVVHSFTLQQEY